MVRLFFHKKFEKYYRKMQVDLRTKVNNRLLTFATNPKNPVLEDHALTGKLQGLRSINITGDYRAWYQWIAVDAVRFVRLGTHPELYGK
jgi:addiction module RelE/StbE family toxin